MGLPAGLSSLRSQRNVVQTPGWTAWVSSWLYTFLFDFGQVAYYFWVSVSLSEMAELVVIVIVLLHKVVVRIEKIDDRYIGR